MAKIDDIKNLKWAMDHGILTAQIGDDNIDLLFEVDNDELGKFVVQEHNERLEAKIYPYEDGDVIVLGPDIFTDKEGSVICWRGVNYYQRKYEMPNLGDTNVSTADSDKTSFTITHSSIPGVASAPGQSDHVKPDLSVVPDEEDKRNES